MPHHNAWGPRALAAARAISLGPDEGDILVSICQRERIGAADSDLNVVTYTQLLEVLQHTAGRPHIRAPFRNLAYTWKIIGWYPRARWLACPAGLFDWPIVLTDETDDTAVPRGRRWRLTYDYAPGLELGPGDRVIPYGVSPLLVHNGAWKAKDGLRDRRADVRIMFAGACSPEMYDKKEIITGRYGKLTRLEVVSCLRRTGLFREVQGAADMPRSKRDGRPVLVDSARYRIPVTEWLPTVASADFLVCPPGVMMPLSHNIVEAMGVGTIPLTNYPEWFFPALEPGVNCLRFDDEGDLAEAVREIVDMPADRVAAMKSACIDYYDRHLDPRATAARLEAGEMSELRIHMIDETYRRIPPGPTAD